MMSHRGNALKTRGVLALLLLGGICAAAQSASILKPAASQGSVNPAGIVYTCDPNITAIAGVCDKLNSQISGLYASTFSNATASIYVRLGSTDLGQSEFYYTVVGYAKFRAALERSVTSANDVTALASSVTVANPIDSTASVLVTSSLARIFGFTAYGSKADGSDCTLGTTGCYDGLVTISSAMQTAGKLYFRNGSIASNQYDFYTVVQHETDEILGTSSCAISCDSGYIAAADLFRYHSDGTRSFAAGDNSPCTAANANNACFSIDGVHMLQQYNNVDNGTDSGDWYSACPNTVRVQDANGCPGVANIDISPAAEILVLDVVGYDLNTKPPLPLSVLTKVTSDSSGNTAGTCTPPSPVASFTPSTVRAWLFFSVTGAQSGDGAQVQFVRPDGTVHSTASLTAGSGYQCFQTSLPINNAPAASFFGVWKAQVLWNGSATPLFALTFTIGASNCTATFDSGGGAFSSAGGPATVGIVAASSCFWTISGAPPWVTLNSSSGGGNATVSFQVLANSGAARTGQLTIGNATYSIEQQASAVPGLGFVGAMPHIAAQDVWTTTFTVVNKSTSAATARLSLFGDPSGNLSLPLAFPQLTPPALPITTTSLDRMLSANASLVLTSAGPQTPPVQIGSAQLSATGPVDGFAIFHLIPGAQEAVVPLETRNAGSYLLAFDNTGGVVLGVAVQNVSNSAATVPVVIRDDTGVVISPPGTTLSLSASGHTSFVLSQQYSFTASKRGTLEFDTPSGGRIAVLGIRQTPLNNTLTLTTIPAIANVGVNGGSIAHIATGNGWQTTFVLVNAGTSAAQATLKFFATASGAPLPIPLSFPQSGGGASMVADTVTQMLAAGASLIVQSAAPASDPAPTIGSAQLTATGNVGGFVIFRYNPNGQEAVVPLEDRSAANGFVIAFDNTSGTATGIAVNSVSAQAAAVPVIVRDDTGAQIATDTLSLAANGHMAFTLGVDKYPVTLNKRGTIEFTTPFGAQIGALGIRIPPALTFTTLPALAK